MRSWSHSSGLPGRRNFPRQNAAFSLIELMVAMTIMSLLFLLAVPTYQKLQRKAKVAALANDFRVFAAAFQAHAHDSGVWPAEIGPGEVPIGMTPEELKYDSWRRTTPMGGQFDWEHDQVHPGATRPDQKVTAAITISSTDDAPLTMDADLFVAVDQTIDDGNPNEGNFRLGYGDLPLFVIEN